ncbi:hypothetical protein NECAME_15522 [Necator americanus]|uniref:Uncharacterized protein n=1 Tax=Necator americanus TaxID=51031 RepID=W2SHM0_NECAM|nr:hypothetical protein NECAME_15522 [Necator americanus]ETN69100.1 hypothetical protein NECAME_15522 [Necator americanus]
MTAVPLRLEQAKEARKRMHCGNRFAAPAKKCAFIFEEQRPLFTIAVLVSGVVGGLAVVIAVVYLYRFCLKKRPPVTT